MGKFKLCRRQLGVLLLLKPSGNGNYCVWFLIAKRRKDLIITSPYELSWPSNEFFKATRWITHTEVLTNKVETVEDASITLFEETFLSSESLRTEKAKIQKNPVFPENQIFCSPKVPAAFPLSRYQLTLAKNTWLPCNGFSSWQQESDGSELPKVEYCYDWSWFSNSVSHKSTVKISFVKFWIINCSFWQDDSIAYLLFSSFLPKFDRPKLPKVMYVRYFFVVVFSPQLVAAFLIQDRFWFWVVLKSETLSFNSCSSNVLRWDFQYLLMHVVLLQIPTRLSETTNWTSFTEVSVGYFICI